MAEQLPLYVETDEAGNVTNFAQFTSSDVVASSVLGSVSAITGFSQVDGVVSLDPEATEVDFGTGSQTIVARNIHFANNLSGHPNSLVRFEGTFSALSGLSVSGPEGVSSNDAGKAFYLRRDSEASYQNLIRAEDGTITLQAEDDVHLKSNTGEDFARFNENAAVWLYHNNSKKIETHTNGAVINGGLSAIGSVSVGTAHITANTVSAISVSATTTMVASTCPIPNPFGYMQLDSDGTDSVDETNLGAGATVTNIVSNTNHISWNDTGKYFNVSAAGIYEVLGVVILEGGSTLVDLSIKKNGSDVLVGQPRVHSTVDPLEHTIRAVFTCAASDYVSITYDATASNSVKAITGSTMSIKRLK